MRSRRVSVRLVFRGGVLDGLEYHLSGLVPASIDLPAGIEDGRVHFARYLVETVKGEPVALVHVGGYQVPTV